MAIYVTSDLHGLPLSELKRLLDSANFNHKTDWLFIIGDVIDRQNDGGVEILKWLPQQPNVQLILGNHEAMLLSCDFVFNEITDRSIEQFDNEKMELLMNYMQNGGDVTLKAFRSLMQTEPETVADILDYLREAPLYETVSVNDKDFLLVHSGLDNFDENKKLIDYTTDELLWSRPSLDTQYFTDGTIVIFGHTPTVNFGSEFKGKILRTKTWIDIDIDILNNQPVLLKLDDLNEYHL